MSKLPYKQSFKSKTNKTPHSEIHYRGPTEDYIRLACVITTTKVNLPQFEISELKEQTEKKNLCEKCLNIGCSEKRYKNKTEEIEELFSVCSGKVYPNDKLSCGTSQQHSKKSISLDQKGQTEAQHLYLCWLVMLPFPRVIICSIHEAMRLIP